MLFAKLLSRTLVSPRQNLVYDTVESQVQPKPIEGQQGKVGQLIQESPLRLLLRPCFGKSPRVENLRKYKCGRGDPKSLPTPRERPQCGSSLRQTWAWMILLLTYNQQRMWQCSAFLQSLRPHVSCQTLKERHLCFTTQMENTRQQLPNLWLGHPLTFFLFPITWTCLCGFQGDWTNTLAAYYDWLLSAIIFIRCTVVFGSKDRLCSPRDRFLEWRDNTSSFQLWG